METYQGNNICKQFGLSAKELFNCAQAVEQENGQKILIPEYLDFKISKSFCDSMLKELDIIQTSLLEKEVILNKAEANIPLFTESCIYFLIHDKQIVYIGQSSSVILRIATHISDRKIFNKCLVIPTEAKDIQIIETAYIQKFSPSYNIAGHSKEALFKMTTKRVNFESF